MALFAVAILVPCLVLTGAGLYLVRQERELAVKRVADNRRRVADQARGALYARLEQIKLREIRNWTPSRPASDPAVALVCVLRDSQMLLPWESDHDWDSARRARREGEFGRLIAQGEQEEFAREHLAAAVESYRRALGHAPSAAQSAYGRLALARALNKQDRGGEARRTFAELLRTPLAVRDEFGVPFAMYAADRLLESGAPETLSPYFRSALREPALSPASLFLLKRLAGRLGTPEEHRLISKRIEWAERAEELKRIAPALLSQHGTGGSDKPAWTPYGDPPWLVTVATALDASQKLLIAVRADALSADVGVPGADLSNRETAGSLALGDPFPGLWLQLPASYHSLAVEGFQTRESFLWAALALVLVVTFFAGFLSWTDMVREIASARVRSEFVESVTHELRTPLSSIRMFAETLRHRTSVDGRIQAECVDTIIGESERLARLVDNVLDFSKIEQGRKIYRMAPVELSRVVEAAVRAMRYPLERKRFSLEVKVDPDLPVISADSDSLEQAILNLLSNAVKYSGDTRQIRLVAERDGDDAVIRVRDKGVGIAPEEHKRIFERFHRVPSPANQDTPGAGLGLTVVEHIVKAHGGSVTLESAPGQGSTFSIRLPIGGAA